MNECNEHVMVWNKGNPCPYCQIDELKAAMVDLAKNIGPVDESKLQPTTVEAWHLVIEEHADADVEANNG